MFQAPGGLNELSDDLSQIWNDQINDQIKRQFSRGFGSRFFVPNPSNVINGKLVNSVKWSGAPAEPSFCLDRNMGSAFE